MFPEIPVYEKLHAKVNFNRKKNSDSCTQDPEELWKELCEGARLTAPHAGRRRPETSARHPDVNLTCHPGAAMVISFEVPNGSLFPEGLVCCLCALWNPQDKAP